MIFIVATAENAEQLDQLSHQELEDLATYLTDLRIKGQVPNGDDWNRAIGPVRQEIAWREKWARDNATAGAVELAIG